MEERSELYRYVSIRHGNNVSNQLKNCITMHIKDLQEKIIYICKEYDYKLDLESCIKQCEKKLELDIFNFIKEINGGDAVSYEELYMRPSILSNSYSPEDIYKKFFNIIFDCIKECTERVEGEALQNETSLHVEQRKINTIENVIGKMDSILEAQEEHSKILERLSEQVSELKCLVSTKQHHTGYYIKPGIFTNKMCKFEID